MTAPSARVPPLAVSLALICAAPVAASAPIEVETPDGATPVYHRATCSASVPAGHARCHARLVVKSDGTAESGKPLASLGSKPKGYGPSDLRSAYNVIATGSASTTIAIIDAYGYPNAEADLAVYRAQYGLPACTTANGCFTKLNDRGGTSWYPTANVGWEQEQALDLDMVSAMCPNCHILLVESGNDSYLSLGLAVTTAIAAGAKILSNSYGGDEAGTETYAATYNQPGVTVVVSTGDSGYGVQFPAALPTVIAVGGTRLTRDTTTSRGWVEKAWYLTGGGCSALYAKPSWQTDARCANRMVADIAATASPAMPVAVYGPRGWTPSSGWIKLGGTSVAAPIIAGIYGALGVTATGAAKIWAATSGYNDITVGRNGTCSVRYFCRARKGYDGPSGIGTPWGAGMF